MGFTRVSASADGKLKQPIRTGVGFIANVLPYSIESEADATLTVSQISGGYIAQGLALTSNVLYTLPTAALILAEWTTMDVGDAFTFYVGNHQTGAFFMQIVVGVGITKVGSGTNLTVVRDSCRMFTLIKTSDTTMDLY